MSWFWMGGLASVASGQEGPARYPDPNVLVGVSAGYPAVLGLRAEGWLSDQTSGEIGVGLPDFTGEELQADLTLRVRPDAFCVGCGRQDLLAVGIGVAAVGVADLDFDEWQLAFGPDVAVTGVHWFNRELGVQATIRGGFGPTLQGPDAALEAVDWWSFGSLGLSF